MSVPIIPGERFDDATDSLLSDVDRRRWWTWNITTHIYERGNPSGATADAERAVNRAQALIEVLERLVR